MVLRLLTVLAVMDVATAFVITPINSFPRVSPLLKATATDAIGALEAAQAASVNAIAASIPDLAPKSDCSWTAESIGGSTATLDARDAPGPANIAWLSSLCVADRLSSLTIFCGPLTDVPHLFSQCAVDGDSLIFSLDFRPRAYGAYEMRKPDGTYPGPEELGRKSFEYSGARNEFDSNFGTEELVSSIQATVAALEGATPNDPSPSELDLLVRGPLYTCLKMPITPGNINVIAAARENAAATWLSWALEDSHAHRPGAPVNTQYVYDSKYKQNAYSALLPVYTSLFGADDGAKLAAADSGPLDEGYVGGGS